ncbi:hypothetical protein MMC28_006691 [Mycoblastus sanguinarius]|nr:hypothetical protein [Mycoblastus sanguinarius]
MEPFSGHSSTVVGILSIFIVLITIVVALRLVSRKISRADVWWDDGFVILSLGSSYALLIVDLTSTKYGVGDQSFYPSKFSTFSKFIYTSLILYPIAITSIKTSILLFYIRLFGVHRPFEIAVYVTQTVVIAWCLASLLMAIFQCEPISDFWASQEARTNCTAANALLVATAVPNTVIDFVILVLPLTMVWKLQLSIRRKVALTSSFLIGTLVCVASIMRLLAVAQVNKPQRGDSDWKYARPLIWSNAETSIGIICACLPTLHPLLHAVSERCLGKRRGSTAHPRSQTGRQMLGDGAVALHNRNPSPDELQGDSSSEIRILMEHQSGPALETPGEEAYGFALSTMHASKEETGV